MVTTKADHVLRLLKRGVNSILMVRLVIGWFLLQEASCRPLEVLNFGWGLALVVIPWIEYKEFDLIKLVSCLQDPKKLDLCWCLSSKGLIKAYCIYFGRWAAKDFHGFKVIQDIGKRQIGSKKLGYWLIS